MIDLLKRYIRKKNTLSTLPNKTQKITPKKNLSIMSYEKLFIPPNLVNQLPSQLKPTQNQDDDIPL